MNWSSDGRTRNAASAAPPSTDRHKPITVIDTIEHIYSLRKPAARSSRFPFLLLISHFDT